MTENEMTGGGGKNVGGSIAERRAAKCGFKPTPRLSTARFRSSDISPLSSPAAVVIRSPFVTIPPGISPTALLDSPVILLHSQALPSPTTGSFQIPFVEYETMPHAVENSNAGKANHFMFKNQTIASSSTSSLQNTDINQVFSPLNHKEMQQTEFGDNGSICKEECPTQEMQLQHRVVSTVSLLSESTLQQQALKEDELAGFTGTVGRQLEDRCNWQQMYRRQKQVECTAFPLSYSMDGEITDIVYKGTDHHHQKPPHSLTAGSAFLYSNSIGEFSDSTAGVGVGPLVSYDEQSIGKNLDQGRLGDEINVNLKVEGLDWASSASIVTTELSDAPPLSNAQEKCSSIIMEYRVTDVDGAATHDKDDDDDDDDEPESKRRKGESLIDSSIVASNSVREPRVVVQTISEIDILEDGYRWRKYGQKVVKGNPNPRSYYKCTHPGCSVRKLVERASHDLKSVITTYEGKHNHAVPAGKSQKPPAAAAAVRPDRGPNLFRGGHEICDLLSCRTKNNAASFHPQIGGFSALSFGPLSSSVPFRASNLDQNWAFRMPSSCFLRVDTGFGSYGYYDQPKASASGVAEFLHGQHESMEEDDMCLSMLPMEEQGNVYFDSNTG